MQSLKRFADVRPREAVASGRCRLSWTDGETVGTLWTLGASPESLVLGYLWNQQLVTDVRSLDTITVDWNAGTATVRSRERAESLSDRNGRQLLGIAARLGTDAAGLLIESGPPSSG